MSAKSLVCWTLVLGAAAAAPLHAQTYKWVDEKGVVNYSNKPPAAAKAKAQVVEDRLSVSSDPELTAATAAMRALGAQRAALAEQEWLQRQRLMLAAQATPYSTSPCPYRVDCGSPFGYGYGPGFVVVRGIRPVHPVLNRPLNRPLNRSHMGGRMGSSRL
ncbi:MAG TPA: DUF4124 domain-containing protein [Burkholderiales bacterium]|nr:DUF4124 domain-containing protein [Burkholderiales bacterium]